MMDAQIQHQTWYVDGKSLELWSVPSVDFSCQPEDIRSYIAGQRWDLVYNALYHLVGAVEEGHA